MEGDGISYFHGRNRGVLLVFSVLHFMIDEGWNSVGFLGLKIGRVKK
ncbi:conserved hypothetical protein [Xenorhabdus nematophila F1]|nr:conserved hypothetical protein [Xenorhabdus nematophila F1]CEE91234.1 hypothetical protein XNA1_200016 [Xenorhabdus nematophila str. Anatoliense]CEF29774.1 hypothetical protein XNW1_2000015 [Xenorhabdus nematophila str. Websteri]CEK21628.1 hypothetical protein XNC2_0632 [Xenorhabdus nematophila AN6/1]CEE92916.1 hypothetical protein XNA1_3180017 [Xenorhabdus nematophila str. Anatoliense]